LEVRVSADSVDVFFRANADAERFPVICIKRSTAEDNDHKSAARVYVAINLNKETRLNGKFCSETRKGSHRKGESKSDIDSGYQQGSFYVSACGTVIGNNKTQNSMFLRQIEHIREALGRCFSVFLC